MTKKNKALLNSLIKELAYAEYMIGRSTSSEHFENEEQRTASCIIWTDSAQSCKEQITELLK